jgi:hypothetical protein
MPQQSISNKKIAIYDKFSTKYKILWQLERARPRYMTDSATNSNRATNIGKFNGSGGAQKRNTNARSHTCVDATTTKTDTISNDKSIIAIQPYPSQRFAKLWSVAQAVVLFAAIKICVVHGLRHIRLSLCLLLLTCPDRTCSNSIHSTNRIPT